MIRTVACLAIAFSLSSIASAQSCKVIDTADCYGVTETDCPDPGAPCNYRQNVRNIDNDYFIFYGASCYQSGYTNVSYDTAFIQCVKRRSCKTTTFEGLEICGPDGNWLYSGPNDLITSGPCTQNCGP